MPEPCKAMSSLYLVDLVGVEGRVPHTSTTEHTLSLTMQQDNSIPCYDVGADPSGRLHTSGQE